jgi:ASPIC and UnbV/FG-GAP-like repeat/Tetratricopeptide repeat
VTTLGTSKPTTPPASRALGAALAFLCAIVLASYVLAAATEPDTHEDASTREMAALLRERAALVNPAKLDFLVNDRRAQLIAEDLEWPRPAAERLQLRLNLARELLAAGKIQESLAALDALETDGKTNAPRVWEAHTTEPTLLRATAFLRLAEEQNCHLGNARDSCLLPIRAGGIHRQREGSTRAIQVLNELLASEPQNLSARWLLNIAHMTLGSYPEGVPQAALIPPAVFAAQYPLPRFDNVAKEVGVDVYGLSGGAILDDFDNDGLLDLVVSSIGFQDQMRYLRNSGNGTFEDRTVQSGLSGEVGGLNLIQADYDNDGFVDVLVLRGGWMGTEGGFPFSLLRNKGNGTFTDVTRAAGLIRFAPSQTATWLDYDGDGWLDLFVGNESGRVDGDPQYIYPCQLYHSNRDGTFTNVAHEVGVDVAAFVKGVVSTDYDNDGRPDIYVSVNGGDNLLFHNEGAAASGAPGWRFKNVAAEAGVTEPQASFGAFFFDYDNDSWPDLFVAGYSFTTCGDVAADYLGLPTSVDRGRLYHNRGDGTFEDVTKAAGLYKVIPAMGLNFGDLDNDGFLDFYLATGNPVLATLVPNRMFRNDGGRTFQDVTTAGNFGHLQKGHAVAFGDIDNDGDQDIFNELGGAYLADKAFSALYENPGNSNRWLSLELEGVRSNKRGEGARIKVVVAGRSGERSIYRTVGSGGSFGGSPLRQEIGLGDATRIVSVEVFWPATGRTQVVAGLQPNRRYRVTEGLEAATRLERPSFKLGGGTKAKNAVAN